MIFRSRYANHWISLPNGKHVRFNNGQLDTKTEAPKLGMSEEELNESLKSGLYYGLDYSAVEVEKPTKRS